VAHLPALLASSFDGRENASSGPRTLRMQNSYVIADANLLLRY